MFVFGKFIIGIAQVLDILLGTYKWIVIVAALISWVNPDPHNPIVRFLYSVTEPVFRPIRRMIGYRLGPVDISPLVVILAIIFAQTFLVGSFMQFGIEIGKRF
jgi:YggT family protein